MKNETLQAPSVRGLPFLGVTLDFMKSPHAFLTDLQKRHGDVVHFRMNLMDYYLLSDPDDIHNFLVRDFENFDKIGMYVKLRKLMGNGLLTCPIKDHRRQKRVLMPAFSQSSLAEYSAVMPQVIYERAKAWRETPDMDLTREMDRLTLSVATQILLGEEFSDNSQIREAVESLIEEFTPGAMAKYFFWSRWFPSSQNQRLKKLRLFFEKVAALTIENGKKNGFSKRNLISVMAKSLLTDEEPSPDALKEMTDQIITLLLAGHDTTATTLTWVWTLLSENPDVEQKLHEEVDRVLGGRLPTAEDLPNLPYIDMILKETMRIHPVAWTINRVAKKDYRVKNFLIKAGSNVSVSPYVTHRNAKFYPDPLRFDPERWTAEEEAKRPAMSYFPFSAGGRGCIGGGFAMNEMKLVLAIVGQMWSFKLKPGQSLECQPRVTLRHKDNVRVELTSRRQTSDQTPVALTENGGVS